MNLWACCILMTGAMAEPSAEAGPQDTASAVPYTPGQVTLEDGTRLAYYVRDGRGPCLVLVPGSWGDYRAFDETVRALDPRLHVVIVELRGHGGSWPPTLQGSMGLFAEDVLRVVDHLGLERFHIGGHSIGGMVAIEVAGRRPEAVAGVVSMEGWTHHEVLRDAFGDRPDPVPAPEHARRRQADRDRVQSRLSEEEIRSFGSVWQQWDGYPILEKTEVPVLEIWGDRGHPRPDRTTMRIPDRPNIELHWVAGASHALLVERPEEVAAAVNAFVADRGPMPVFLDTDIAPDVDDVAAVAILHALADAGEAEIVAMAACTSSPWGALCLRALNEYYGRPDIPLGTFRAGPFLEESSYNEGVARTLSEEARQDTEVSEAVDLYRRVLAGRTDARLTVIAIGPLNNLVRLLDSPPDAHSPLSGTDLVREKVRELVVMGPYFNEKGEFQYAWNYAQDPEAAWQVMQRWPSPMRFGEGNLGHRHFIGAGLADAPPDSPVRLAFELAEGPGGKRHCADPSTILYAIRGTRHFGEVREGGCDTRREDGFTRWTSTPDLPHAYNTQQGSVEELEAVLEDLLTRTPAAQRRP